MHRNKRLRGPVPVDRTIVPVDRAAGLFWIGRHLGLVYGPVGVDFGLNLNRNSAWIWTTFGSPFGIRFESDLLLI